MSVKAVLLFFVLAFFTTSLVPAKADQPNIVESKGNFSLVSIEDFGMVLSLSGTIQASSVADFLDIRRNRDIAAIVLDSPGGDLNAGITISELVSLEGISTWIPEDAECASACALIFFAGNPRRLEGRVGVHQYRTLGGTADNESDAQERIGRLMELLNSFETPLQAIERAALTRPHCMYWFDSRHADLMRRGSNITERLDGVLECSEPIDAAPSIQERPLREIRREIQAELNRVGCHVGTPDGIIGPRSIQALRDFSMALNIAHEEANFERERFLLIIRSITDTVCVATARPAGPDLAGNWSLSGRCSYTPVAISGRLTATEQSSGRYSLRYLNNLGETGDGTIVQNGHSATVTVRWNNGASTVSHMNIDPSGARISGTSSNGCVFEVWR